MIMKFKESSLLKNTNNFSETNEIKEKSSKIYFSDSRLKKAVIKKQEGGTLFSIYNSIDPYIPPTIDFNAPELETEIVTNPIKKRQAKVIEEAKKSTANSEVQELKEINSEIPSKKFLNLLKLGKVLIQIKMNGCLTLLMLIRKPELLMIMQ